MIINFMSFIAFDIGWVYKVRLYLPHVITQVPSFPNQLVLEGFHLISHYNCIIKVVSHSERC